MSNSLPVDACIPDLHQALEQHHAAVVIAAPGAGKSTRVPPSFLGHIDKRIDVLQPRRMAARSLARRIAQEQGVEAGGDVVGWHVRHEKRGNERTKLWLLTEGLLTRRLHHDPFLEDTGLVILDEFHERSLHADIALGWLNQLAQSDRPDLKIIVMSATIDPGPVATALGGAPIIDAPGREYPITVSYQAPRKRQRTGEAIAEGIESLIKQRPDDHGNILAFAPGVGEISGALHELRHLTGDYDLLPLHGSLPSNEQDCALGLGDKPKIIIATNVAETSLTIPGTTMVVDAGLVRMQRHDPECGMDTLRTERISLFSAEQRAGRAGRTAPGHCLRLWSKLEQQRLKAATDAEIERTDLAPLVMQLRSWFGDDVRTFPWFSPPPEEALLAAEQLLHMLGFTTGPFASLTGAGRYIANLPIHPRLARLLLAAEQRDCLALGARIAAITSERSLQRRNGPSVGHATMADVEDDLYLCENPNHPSADRQAVRQIQLVEKDLLRQWGSESNAMIHHDSIRDHIPFLLLAAYPDRVGKRSATGSNRIRLGDGSTVELEEKSCAYLPRGKKASERELIVAARCQGLSGRGRSASVRCASAAIIEEDDLSTVFPDGVQEREELRYDPAKDKVTAERTRRFGNLVLSYQQSEPHDRNTAAALLAEHLAERFASVLAEQWPETHHFMSRWAWLRQQRPELEWPDPKDPSVVHDICQAWAADQLSLKGLPDPLAFAQTALGWDQLATLDQLAPASLTLSRGRGNRQKTITYPEDGSTPSLSAFIQDWFGTTRHPSINDGRTPLKLDLLAPNRRTAQITEDLPGFFAGYYALVRKDLKGRYPKHDWPEKPGSTQ